MIATLLLTLTALPVDDSAEWARRLAGEERAAAREELRALGRRAAPILAEVIAEGELVAAWEATTLFVALGKDGKSQVDELGGVCKRTRETEERRSLAILALGATHDGGAVPFLEPCLLDAKEPLVVFHARLALGRLGKPAVKRLAKLMEHDSPRVRLSASEALLAIGPDARSAKKALVDCLDDNRSFYSWAIARSALLRMGKAGRSALDKPWKKRVREFPVSVGGLVPMDVGENPKLAAQIAMNAVQLDFAPEKLVLPEAFVGVAEDGKVGSLGEIVMLWAEHLAVTLHEIGREVYESPPVSFEAWLTQTESARNTDEIIRAFVPR